MEQVKLMIRNISPEKSSPPLRDLLQGVIRRRQIATGVQYAVGALLLCAVGTIVGLLATLPFQASPPRSLGVVPLVAGPALAFFFGLLKRCSAADAATEADRCYALQDRLVSAVEFERIDNATPLHQLQISDARIHAANVDPRVVVPLKMPRHAWISTTLAILAMGLMLVPRNSPQTIPEKAAPLQSIVEESNRLAAQAENLTGLAADAEDTTLSRIADEIRGTADTVRRDSTDVGDALEEISRLQEAIRRQQVEYDVDLVQNQLQRVANALSNVGGLEETALAIEQLDFAAAAEALEHLDPDGLDPPTAHAAGEDLGKAAEQLDQSQLKQLAESVRKMGQGLQDDDHAALSTGAKQLAKALREHAQRMQSNSQLQNQQAALAESKARLVNGQSVDVAGQKSQRSSSEIGTGVDGNLQGSLSQLESQRQRFEMNGVLGEGESEIESSIAQSGNDTAKRSYRDVFQHYEKLSQAVLETEAIPLGHRQTIRRYFELIRPTE